MEPSLAAFLRPRPEPRPPGCETPAPWGPSPLSLQQAKFALYRCSLLLGWRLPHTLFCALAWERGLSARHFLWSRLVRGLGWRRGAPGCSWDGELGGGGPHAMTRMPSLAS